MPAAAVATAGPRSPNSKWLTAHRNRSTAVAQYRVRHCPAADQEARVVFLELRDTVNNR